MTIIILNWQKVLCLPWNPYVIRKFRKEFLGSILKTENKLIISIFQVKKSYLSASPFILVTMHKCCICSTLYLPWLFTMLFSLPRFKVVILFFKLNIFLIHSTYWPDVNAEKAKPKIKSRPLRRGSEHHIRPTKQISSTNIK